MLNHIYLDKDFHCILEFPYLMIHQHCIHHLQIVASDFHKALSQFERNLHKKLDSHSMNSIHSILHLLKLIFTGTYNMPNIRLFFNYFMNRTNHTFLPSAERVLATFETGTAFIEPTPLLIFNAFSKRKNWRCLALVSPRIVRIFHTYKQNLFRIFFSLFEV